MKYSKYHDLRNDLIKLFDKFNLLNLWVDLIKIINYDIDYFLKIEGRSFWNKLKIILVKYNIDTNDVLICLNKDFWILKIKINNKQNITINLRYKKWNFQKEKDKKILILNIKFSDELKKLYRIKKCLFSKTDKVLIYPIINKNYPIFPISKLIENNYQNLFSDNKLNLKKLLVFLEICSENKINDFLKFLYIIESRLVTKLENEILPFIENISLINQNLEIKEIYYFDSPDFIVIYNDEAVGVEVTNIKHKKKYYLKQSSKENSIRKLINSSCFYSKNLFLYKQKKIKAKYNKIKELNSNISYKTESLSRHFSNNSKYNYTIRKNGLKVRRGQKNFFILNGWDKKDNLYQKKLIKNIADKKNIPFKRLIFFDINETEEDI